MQRSQVINGTTFVYSEDYKTVTLKGSDDKLNNEVTVPLETLFEFVGRVIQSQALIDLREMTGKQVLSNLTTLFKEEK